MTNDQANELATPLVDIAAAVERAVAQMGPEAQAPLVEALLRGLAQLRIKAPDVNVTPTVVERHTWSSLRIGVEYSSNGRIAALNVTRAEPAPQTLLRS